jgi:ATP-binding cassette, subfamily B, bacterial MsbA
MISGPPIAPACYLQAGPPNVYSAALVSDARSTFRILRRLLHFGRPHRRRLLQAFAAMAVLGLTTGAYAWLMGPALKFLLGGSLEGLGQLARWLPFLADRDSAWWSFPAILVAIGLVKGAAYLGQFYWIGLYGQEVAAEVRRALFSRLLAFSPVQLSGERSGDLLSRFSADVSAVELAATYSVGSYIRDTLQIVVLLGVALALDWRIALGTLVVLPLAAWPVSRLTRSFLRRARQGQEGLGQLAAQIQEGLGALRTVQAFNAEQAEQERFRQSLEAQRRVVVRAGWLRAAVPGIMEVLAAAAVAGALAWALGAKSVPPEKLISLITALVLLYQPIKDLGRLGQFALQAAVAGERIFAVLDAPQALTDAAGARPLQALREEIRLEDLRFAYGDRPAIDGLSLPLRMGEVTALVGGSGGGKSTLTTLLLRFERPQAGRLLFDGVDADALTVDSIRAQFALVTQEPLLFSASILENLRVGRPEATLEEVREAAQVACAHEFIAALPQGYDTRVGERGQRLSGGQRQRLCLARAVLARAPVLLLDEPTSSLDPQSEAEVQQALQRVLPGRTALVIAHRLSTIAAADLIHVVEQGKVVESGSLGELLARGGRFAELWRLQHGQQPQASVA